MRAGRIVERSAAASASAGPAENPAGPIEVRRFQTIISHALSCQTPRDRQNAGEPRLKGRSREWSGWQLRKGIGRHYWIRTQRRSTYSRTCLHSLSHSCAGPTRVTLRRQTRRTHCRGKQADCRLNVAPSVPYHADSQSQYSRLPPDLRLWRIVQRPAVYNGGSFTDPGRQDRAWPRRTFPPRRCRRATAGRILM
jgi:hypothetical protein